MDKNLLKEFIIEEYEKDFVVYATDEAYRLLGVEVPQPISPVTEYTVDRTHHVVIRNVSGDTIDVEYYREAVLTYLASRYRIDGLLRESDGNSHDANWQYEVYIFNTGYCPEELSSCIIKTGGLYLSATKVLKKEKITEEIIETWSEEYDLDGNGEGQRTVYCSTPDGSAHFAFGLSLSWRLGRKLPENRYPLALRTSRSDMSDRLQDALTRGHTGWQRIRRRKPAVSGRQRAARNQGRTGRRRIRMLPSLPMAAHLQIYAEAFLGRPLRITTLCYYRYKSAKGCGRSFSRTGPQHPLQHSLCRETLKTSTP